MPLEPKLTHFFNTKDNIYLRHFTDDIRASLESALSDPDVYKSERMNSLLSQQSFTFLEWLEWFNWFSVAAMKVNEPDWLVQAKVTVATSQNISLMSYPQFLQHGWKIKDIVVSSVLLSDSGITNYHANSEEVEHWSRLRSKNLNLFSGAVLAGELIGQVGFIQLDANEYELLKQGDIIEEELIGVPDKYTGPVYLYAPSVVLKPEWRNKSLLFKLFKHLMGQLEQQPELVSRVKGVIALAYTKEGASLCDRFNFKLEPSQVNSEIRVYSGELEQILALFKH